MVKLRRILLLLTLVYALGISINTFGKANNYYCTNTMQINVNGTKLTTEYVVDNGRIMIPLRTIGKVLDATIQWKSSDILITKRDIKIKMVINNEFIEVNNKKVKLTNAPIIISGKIMVPIRCICKVFHVIVNYDKEYSTIYLIDKSRYLKKDNNVNAYMLAIDTLYKKDDALNEGIKYIAIDYSKVKYLSTEEREQLKEKVGKYNCIVLESTFEELEKSGLINNKKFDEGILFRIDDAASINNQLILSIEKWRSSLGSNGYKRMVLEEVNGMWEIIETKMYFQS